MKLSRDLLIAEPACFTISPNSPNMYYRTVLSLKFSKAIRIYNRLDCIMS